MFIATVTAAVDTFGDQTVHEVAGMLSAEHSTIEFEVTDDVVWEGTLVRFRGDVTELIAMVEVHQFTTY